MPSRPSIVAPLALLLSLTSPCAALAEDRRAPAKLEVARATVSERHRHVDVLAPITSRASGEVRVEVHAAGRRTRFGAPVDSRDRHVRFERDLPRAQARLGTGIVTLDYPGDGDTQPQTVRLRAAAVRARLTSQRPSIEGERLRTRGSVDRRATGVVRVQLHWTEAGAARSREYHARIRDGRWQLDQALDEETLAGIAKRDGTLHSSVLFTGDLEQRMRGEMDSWQVMPGARAARQVAGTPVAERDDPAPGGSIAFGTAVRAGLLAQGGEYAAASTRFTSWTPENELKMEALAPHGRLGRPVYDFARADALVERALREGREVHGHALVFDQQIPEWVLEWPWSPDSLRAFLRDYVHTVVGRYKGRIASWDVVNEPFESDGSYARTFWYQQLGPGYIADVFRWAHEADPGATLYLNEVLDVRNPIGEASLRLVQQLRADGVPVHGIGLQTHVEARQQVLTRESFRSWYEQFAALGVKVAVSEIDVDTTGSDEARQAAVFGAAAAACVEVPACERYTVWGVSDAHGWRGAGAAALPIAADYRLKPAWSAIERQLARRTAWR